MNTSTHRLFYFCGYFIGSPPPRMPPALFPHPPLPEARQTWQQCRPSRQRQQQTGPESGKIGQTSTEIAYNIYYTKQKIAVKRQFRIFHAARYGLLDHHGPGRGGSRPGSSPNRCRQVQTGAADRAEVCTGQPITAPAARPDREEADPAGQTAARAGRW